MSDPLDMIAGPTAAATTPGNLLLIAWRRKSVLLLGLAVGLVLGMVWYLQETPIYQANAQIMVIQKQGNPLSSFELDPRAYFFEDYLATHQTLLKSPRIAQRVVQNPRFKTLPSYARAGDAAGLVAGSITVSRDSRDSSGMSSNILNLSMRGPNAEDCAAVLDILIEEYKAFLREKYTNTSVETVSQITSAAEELRRSLDEKEQAYAEFQRTMSTAVGGEAVSEEWLARMQSERLALQVQRVELQSRIDGIERAVKEGRGRETLLAQSSLPASKGTEGSVPSLEQQIFALELKEQLLLADFGPDHPEVAALRKQIELTRRFISGDDGNGDPVQVRLRGLKQQVAEIDQKLASLNTIYDPAAMAAYRIEDKRHRDGIARANRLFEPTTQRLAEIKLIQDFGGFDAEIIAPPAPGGKVAPSLRNFLFMSILLGLFGGGGLAYLLDVTDKSFRDPEEIRRRLGLPVIGHVPFVPAKDSLAAAGDLPTLAPALWTAHQPKSVQAEAFRGLRTGIYFNVQGEDHRVIQVTSVNPSDGKSTVSANLAISIAQSGKSVVLVDCDFRKPCQHKLFQISPAVGLASVILEKADLHDAIQKSPIPGLSLLPCGPRPANPAELLTSPRFQELLEVLRGQYDYVIVDTPPLLAVSDPSVVAPRVDGVILTIRVTKNGRPGAERAREMLSSVGANILGIVVNGTGEKNQRYGKAAHYYAYYSDYHAEEGAEGASAAAPRKARPATSILSRLWTW